MTIGTPRNRFLFVVVAAIAFIGLPPLARQSAATPLQWSSGVGGNDHWYDFTISAGSWLQAEAEAVSTGGHLASINSAAEQAFVDMLLTGYFFNHPVWIGLNDESVEGTFVWSSGEAVTYTNWEPFEPNDAAGSEDYVAMNWHFNSMYGGAFGTWNDTPLFGTSGIPGNGFGGEAEGPYFGLVETIAAPVPEPATLVLCGTGLLAVARRFRKRA